MRFRLGIAAAGAVFGAILIVACFPDYKFTDRAGSDAGIDGEGAADALEAATKDAHVEGGMVLLESADASFTLPVSGLIEDGGSSARSELTHAFLMDTTEVTVGRFKAWVDAGLPAPCGGSGSCSLDPSGPYFGKMSWDASWNTKLTTAGWTDPGCHDGDPDDSGIRATYDLSNPDLPMTCVSWYQAAAFCNFERKRLPTETEWRYAATNQATQTEFAFWQGGTTPGCDTCIYRESAAHCGFPVPVGTAYKGVSAQGIYDLSGSVFEWHWDWWSEPFPSFARDYAGPLSGSERVRPSGSYINANGDGALHSDSREHHPPDEVYSDAGFRCARTVP